MIVFGLPIRRSLTSPNLIALSIVVLGLLFRLLLLLPRLDQVPDNPDARHYLLIAEYALQHGYSAYREPVFPMLVIALSPVTGLSYFTVRLASLIAGTLMVFVTFKLAQEIFGKTAAAFAGAYVAFDYILAINSIRGLREEALGLMILVTLYCVVKAEKTARMNWILATGMSAGLAFLTRIDALLVLIVLLIYLTWRIETHQVSLRRSSVLVLGGVFAAVAAAFVLWQLARFGDFLPLRVAAWNPEDPKLGNPGFLEIMRIRGYYGVIGVLDVWRRGAGYFAYTTFPRAFPLFSQYLLAGGIVILLRRNVGIIVGAVLSSAVLLHAYLNGAVIVYANHAYDHRLLFPFLPLGAVAVAGFLTTAYEFLEKPPAIVPDTWIALFTVKLVGNRIFLFRTSYLVLVYFAALILSISTPASACAWYYYCG